LGVLRRNVHPVRGNLKLAAINNKTRNISVNDLKLNKAVDYYNSQLLLLNNVVTPKFGSDNRYISGFVVDCSEF
jgi:hypothetical protein